MSSTLSDPAQQERPTPRKATGYIPPCTHIRMGVLHCTSERRYCQFCLMPPRNGTLYYCQEDELLDYIGDHPKVKAAPEEPAYIQQMIDLGMSPSVVQQARSAQYSPEQVEKLIKQRMGVLAAIAQAAKQKTMARSPGFTPQPALGAMNTPSTPVEDAQASLSLSDVHQRAMESHKHGRREICKLLCCNTCRPFAVERARVSLNGVLEEDSSWEALYAPYFEPGTSHMPVSDVSVVRGLGLDQAHHSSECLADLLPEQLTISNNTSDVLPSADDVGDDEQELVLATRHPKTMDDAHHIQGPGRNIPSLTTTYGLSRAFPTFSRIDSTPVASEKEDATHAAKDEGGATESSSLTGKSSGSTIFKNEVNEVNEVAQDTKGSETIDDA